MSSYPLDHCDQEQNEFFPSLNLASVMEVPQTVFLSPSALYRHLMFPATVAPTSVTWTLPPTTTFTHEVSSRQSLLFALTEQDEVQCASNMQDSTGNPQDSTGNPQNTSSDTGPGLPNIGLVSQDTSRGLQQSSCELQDPHFAVQDTSGMEMRASMFGYVSRRSVSGVRGIVKPESELGIKQEVVGNCLSPPEAFPVVHQDICVEAGSSLEHEQQQQNRFEMKPEVSFVKVGENRSPEHQQTTSLETRKESPFENQDRASLESSFEEEKVSPPQPPPPAFETRQENCLENPPETSSNNEPEESSGKNQNGTSPSDTQLVSSETQHPPSYFQQSNSSVEGRRQVPPKTVVVNYEDDLLETTLNQTVKIDVDDVEAEFLDFDFAAALRELDAFHPQSKKLSSVQDVESSVQDVESSDKPSSSGSEGIRSGDEPLKSATSRPGESGAGESGKVDDVIVIGIVRRASAEAAAETAKKKLVAKKRKSDAAEEDVAATASVSAQVIKRKRSNPTPSDRETKFYLPPMRSERATLASIFGCSLEELEARAKSRQTFQSSKLSDDFLSTSRNSEAISQPPFTSTAAAELSPAEDNPRKSGQEELAARTTGGKRRRQMRKMQENARGPRRKGNPVSASAKGHTSKAKEVQITLTPEGKKIITIDLDSPPASPSKQQRKVRPRDPSKRASGIRRKRTKSPRCGQKGKTDKETLGSLKSNVQSATDESKPGEAVTRVKSVSNVTYIPLGSSCPEPESEKSNLLATHSKVSMKPGVVMSCAPPPVKGQSKPCRRFLLKTIPPALAAKVEQIYAEKMGFRLRRSNARFGCSTTVNSVKVPLSSSTTTVSCVQQTTPHCRTQEPRFVSQAGRDARRKFPLWSQDTDVYVLNGREPIRTPGLRPVMLEVMRIILKKKYPDYETMMSDSMLANADTFDLLSSADKAKFAFYSRVCLIALYVKKGLSRERTLALAEIIWQRLTWHDRQKYFHETAEAKDIRRWLQLEFLAGTKESSLIPPPSPDKITNQALAGLYYEEDGKSLTSFLHKVSSYEERREERERELAIVADLYRECRLQNHLMKIFKEELTISECLWEAMDNALQRNKEVADKKREISRKAAEGIKLHVKQKLNEKRRYEAVGDYWYKKLTY